MMQKTNTYLVARAREFCAPSLPLPWLLPMAYAGGIYWLSSLPLAGIGGVDASLFHVPLYAGLAYCLLKAASEAPSWDPGSWKLRGMIFAVAASYGVLDEWHQSFVPGRQASGGDLVLDLLGIGVMLLLMRR